MRRLGLFAMMLAGVLFFSPVGNVFWTARERSQRYTFFGVRPPDPLPLEKDEEDPPSDER